MNQDRWNDLLWDLMNSGSMEASRPHREKLAAHMAKLEEELDSLKQRVDDLSALDIAMRRVINHE